MTTIYGKDDKGSPEWIFSDKAPTGEICDFCVSKEDIGLIYNVQTNEERNSCPDCASGLVIAKS